jgi:hypothetical protein
MAQSILDPIFSGSGGIAKSLINLLGGDATIYLPTGTGAYNPLTGTDTTGGLDSGTPIDLAALEDVTEKDVNETTILMGDFKCLVPQSDVTLLRSHIQFAEIEFNSTRYKLVEFKPVHSGQNIAMYTVYLRNT